MIDQNTIKKPKQEGSKIEEVAQQLNVALPKVNLPLGLKIIAVLTLLGGLGALSNTFAGLFSQQDFELKSYLLRLFSGMIFILISYGIIKKQNWSTWVYGIMVVVALFINWPLAILPAMIVVYMYLNRKYFQPSVFDKFFNLIKTKFNTLSNKVSTNLDN